MSSKTKIVVLHMKEIIYTVIFAVFALLIIGLLCSMFLTGNKDTSTPTYAPGVYSSEILLNDTLLTIEVSVGEHNIESVRISNLDDSINSLYPLLQPTIEDLSTQICLSQSTKNISVSDENSNTAALLLSGIEDALKKAAVQ